ncbi:MAG: ABC transporter permease, partial [Rubrivivax sp.]|nr:ABC transporter permease [Rubrivivax sp.]
MNAPAFDTGAEAVRRSLQRVQRQRRVVAIALTLPLLIFLLATLLVPIGALLVRAIENPEVAGTLPRTSNELADWDRHTPPPAAAFAAVAADLQALEDGSMAGALARRLNSEVSGGRSLIMGTFRAVRDADAWPSGLDAGATRERMLALDDRWDELKYWQAIAKNSSRWTPDYLLASVDLRRSAEGDVIRMPPDQRVFGRILLRTFEISVVVTLWCLLLAYPLAWWLSTLSARKANLLMILVLVPFWTSVLVRVAA